MARDQRKGLISNNRPPHGGGTVGPAVFVVVHNDPYYAPCVSVQIPHDIPPGHICVHACVHADHHVGQTAAAVKVGVEVLRPVRARNDRF